MDKEKQKQYMHDYYIKNKERLKAKDAERYAPIKEANRIKREKAKEERQKYLEEHAEEIRQKRLEYGKEYQKKNRERLNAYRREWYHKNPERCKAAMKRWQDKKKEEIANAQSISKN